MQAKQIGRFSPGGTPVHSERLEFRIVLALSFLACLAMVVSRRIGARLRGKTRVKETQSIFAEARSAAYAAAGYAFIAC